MDQLTQLVQGAVNTIETAAEDFQKLDGEGLAASFGEGKKTGAIVAGMVGLGKLDRFLRNLDKTASVTKGIGPTLNDLSRAAGAIDKGGFTVAGRSLTKHGAGARPGNSLFPAAKGNPAAINRQAQDLVDDILTNPGTKVINSQRGRFGNTIEHVAPDGRGVVFDSNGKFLFFREGGL